MDKLIAGRQGSHKDVRLSLMTTEWRGELVIISEPATSSIEPCLVAASLSMTTLDALTVVQYIL